MADATPAKNTTFTKMGRLSNARAKEFSIVHDFKYGYRNREDITNLPPGVLVTGSQNVLTNVSDRIAIRQGFTLDGQSSTNQGGWPSSYDWDRHTGDERNIRVGDVTPLGNDGKYQCRYIASAGDYYNGITFTEGQVYWIDIIKGLTSTSLNFAEFWDFNTEKKGFLLSVDGSSNITEWSGGIGTVASSTAISITINGVPSIAEQGFYTQSTSGLTINSNLYTYTGVSGNTFTGVTPDPTAEPVNSVLFQTVKITANSSMTAIPSTFANSLIGNLRNQIYIGSLVDNTVYISKLNNYMDYSFSTPRVVGEGALVTLDAPPIAFVPQEDKMYFASGRDFWFETKFTLSADLTGESFEIIKLKTGSQQAAQSQSMVSKMKNEVVFISNEPTMDTLGRVEQILGTPQSMNMSDPIKLDFDSYDFTDSNVFYFQYFVYIAIPKQGIVRMYNLVKQYWEAPQLLPVGRFAVIGGEIYGHGYGTSETYKLFSGYNDNGKSMEAIAVFSFMNGGTRTALKSFNEFYVEGYITSNTSLTLGIQYDVDGCATNTSYDISGSDGQFVCLGGASDDASLGKISFGKRSLGGSSSFTSSSSLPPKFRWIPTFNQIDHFEYQPSFYSVGIDQRWEILAFGGRGGLSNNIAVKIKQ